MNMFIVIFLYLFKCICIFFVPLINLMKYFVIFVMFSIIKHISYHVMVHDWNKKYLILSYRSLGVILDIQAQEHYKNTPMQYTEIFKVFER